MKNKKKKRKAKKGLFVIIILLLIAILAIIIVPKKLKKKKPEQNQVVEVVDKIDNFEYELKDNETKYYNELFEKLKKLLSEENYEEEEYAALIGQLFLVDFYDLDSKVMKSDVGGTQFVYNDYRSDFEKGATTTVYKYVESNVYGDRKQDLPIVKNVEKTEITTKTYKSDMVTDNNAYNIKFKIEYSKDLGYPKDVQLILVHNETKLEIVSMETL